MRAGLGRGAPDKSNLLTVSRSVNHSFNKSLTWALKSRWSPIESPIHFPHHEKNSPKCGHHYPHDPHLGTVRKDDGLQKRVDGGAMLAGEEVGAFQYYAGAVHLPCQSLAILRQGYYVVPPMNHLHVSQIPEGHRSIEHK